MHSINVLHIYKVGYIYERYFFFILKVRMHFILSYSLKQLKNRTAIFFTDLDVTHIHVILKTF